MQRTNNLYYLCTFSFLTLIALSRTAGAQQQQQEPLEITSLQAPTQTSTTTALPAVTVTQAVESPADREQRERVKRVLLATLATAGFGAVVGIASVSPIAVGVGLGVPAAIIGGSVACVGAGLFALPAIYTVTANALGGRGSYWATFAGNGIALASMVGAGFGIVRAFPRGDLVPVFAFAIAPVFVLGSMALGYELSHRPAVAPQSPSTHVVSTLTASLWFTESHRGVFVSGQF